MIGADVTVGGVLSVDGGAVSFSSLISTIGGPLTVTGLLDATSGLTVSGGTLVVGSSTGIVRATSGAYSVGSVDLSTFDVTGTLPATSGGTGYSVFSVGDFLFASTTTTLGTLAIGTTGDVLTVAAGVPSWASPASILAGTSWLLGGNTGITASNNIIGLTDVNANPLRFFTNNTEAMRIASNGDVAIGTTPVSSYKLTVMWSDENRHSR